MGKGVSLSLLDLKGMFPLQKQQNSLALLVPQVNRPNLWCFRNIRAPLAAKGSHFVRGFMSVQNVARPKPDFSLASHFSPRAPTLKAHHVILNVQPTD